MQVLPRPKQERCSDFETWLVSLATQQHSDENNLQDPQINLSPDPAHFYPSNVARGGRTLPFRVARTTPFCIARTTRNLSQRFMLHRISLNAKMSAKCNSTYQRPSVERIGRLVRRPLIVIDKTCGYVTISPAVHAVACTDQG